MLHFKHLRFGNAKMRDWMPVLFCGLSVPLSLFMWLGNVAVSRLWSSDYEGEPCIHI